MSDESETLLAANRAFYDAFARRDAAAMEALWSSEAPIACIHPGWDALVGRKAVMESWRRILSNPAQPRISCRDEVPMVADRLGLVLCHEILDQVVLVASNTFLRETAGWRMIHHQSSPTDLSPSRVEAPRGPLH